MNAMSTMDAMDAIDAADEPDIPEIPDIHKKPEADVAPETESVDSEIAIDITTVTPDVAENNPEKE